MVGHGDKAGEVSVVIGVFKFWQLLKYQGLAGAEMGTLILVVLLSLA
jgi:hypothetical protein